MKMPSLPEADHMNGEHLMNGYNRITDDANEAKPVEVPVLIIGGGPTGLLQAYLLSRLQVKSMIVERYPERLGAPKAHALSPRSLEICRQFGLDVRRIRKLGTPRSDAFWVNFVTNLSSESVGRLPYERMDSAVLDATPEMIHNIPQPDFEQFVTDHLCMDSNVEIRKGVSFISCENENGRVVTIVEERVTGHRFRIRSQHLIACDGAKSKVREHLGIESEGEDSYETMMTIHFSANLRPVIGKRVGMLHWIMDPAVAGFIIGYNLEKNQVLICNFDSDKHPVDTWNEELCRSVVTAAIGVDIPFDILSYRPWLLSRKVSKSYRSGNVFLAGDAAHSFPPTGGLGLNSGLGDVHNLAYKIAAVHKNWAAESILDSYQLERQKVADVNSRQSVKNGKKIFGLLKTLGTTGDTDLSTSRKNLYQAIHDPVKRKLVDEGVEDQREHFDNLELHIGYVYGSPEYPENASNYLPRFLPGARLPHAWIAIPRTSSFKPPRPVDVSYVSEFSVEAQRLRQFTTLDLCALDAFTLIVAEPESFKESVECVRLHYLQTGFSLNIYCVGRDFELVPGSHAEAWLTGTGLNVGGGLLVRPDQHILARLAPDAATDSILRELMMHMGQ